MLFSTFAVVSDCHEACCSRVRPDDKPNVEAMCLASLEWARKKATKVGHFDSKSAKLGSCVAKDYTDHSIGSSEICKRSVGSMSSSVDPIVVVYSLRSDHTLDADRDCLVMSCDRHVMAKLCFVPWLSSVD